MRPKRKEWETIVPRPLAEVWAFFSRPENLNAITPEEMTFEILSPLAGQEMYPGMIVHYRIAPLLGVPLDWVTEITQIREQSFFIDDQRVGPYALWHHQHHFEPHPRGTLMRDILHYQVPYGPLGTLVNWLFVERQVEEIFRFREAAIRRRFG